MPNWINNIVFYEIYPQSFFDTNADGIGDLRGVIQKLDYIKALGCDGIWLNPCFASPFFDAGYDISDYMQVAPRYGTNEDLRELFHCAHQRGMKVILDLVPGHTSIYHPWFVQSCKAEHNVYSDRYIWSDDVWENFQDVQGVQGFLRGCYEREGCCACNFFSIQPALNYGFYHVEKNWQQPVDAPGPRASCAALQEIMRFWLSMGCDGFRVDMAGEMVKNDPEQEGTISLWQEFRKLIDREFPDAALISEWGNPSRALRGGFHMDFLLHFGPTHYMDLFRTEEPYFSRRGKGDISAFVRTYETTCQTVAGGFACIPSGNHDMPRMRQTLDEAEMKLAFLFLLSMPGVPFIYYGDEIAMRHLEGLSSMEGAYYRTGARTPMQWDRSANAGFSSAPPEKLYIPIDPDQQRPNVADALSNPNSLYHTIRQLIELRKNHPALQSCGKIKFLYAEKNAYPVVFQRVALEETIILVINPSGQQAQCTVDGLGALKPIYILGETAWVCNGQVTAPAASATMFQMEHTTQYKM